MIPHRPPAQPQVPVPEVGSPYGLGPIPLWEQNLSARLEAVKSRLRVFDRESRDLDPEEKLARIVDIWDDVRSIYDDTKVLATSRGEWPELRLRVGALFSKSPDFDDKVRSVLLECQIWLVTRGYILGHNEQGVNYATILKRAIDKELIIADAGRESREPRATHDVDHFDRELSELDDEDEEDDDGDPEP